MSGTLRKVALIGGSGNLGPHLLDALRKDSSFEVTVICRQSSQSQFPAETKIIRVADNYPIDEVTAAFRGHDAVVLSLTFTDIMETLVDAAIAAGVKRLIPSMWGGRLDDAEAREIFPPAAAKARQLDYVKFKETLGWSWTGVTCGPFLDLCIQKNFFGFDSKTRTGRIWDDGEKRFAVTTYKGVGQALVGILHNPLETANRIVHVSSMEMSLNELLMAYKDVTEVTEWDITYGDTEAGIRDAREQHRTAWEFGDRMEALALLGLLTEIRKEGGAHSGTKGIADNDLLGVAQENLVECVRQNLT
ncbi:isoflavone reductase family protein-like protein [Lophiostoma macrostomum CBS 122681]|uniref:Isoflavone reductase family protein-like protein n=1 Tax=Lophiostoma macrostomum CBS 122681 TaxID=1314788 RepID=A0A6A6SSN1_9PLEO|nr:isoflavone reductase family protein-like protein [Lophiostoma macrostomum CBS 122681]